MALFHLSVTQTKRSAGQSAIASAAYRAGEQLYSEYYGEYSDYTRKQDYAEYRQIRKEKEELLIAKRTVETILNIDRQKEQEQEKKSVR